MNRTRLPVLSPLVYLVVGLALLVSGAAWEMVPRLVAEPTGTADWWHLVPLLVACAGIVVQRRAVLAGFAVASAAVVADAALGLHLGVFLAWADAAYTFARRAGARQRRAAIVLSLLAVVGLGAVLAGTPEASQYAVPVALTLIAGVAVPFWWGAEVRSGDVRAARADAAAQLERERSEAARRRAERARAEAVQRERTAMARELHDTVSAHLTGIALHVAAALSGEPDEEVDRRALRHSRTAALEALEQMRTMIGLLRQPGEPLDLQVRDGLDALPVLVARNREAGLDVAADLEPVPVDAAEEQALLRVAQEGLANALKHGTGYASIALTSSADTVRLEIENPVAEHPLGGHAGLPPGHAGASSGQRRVPSDSADPPAHAVWPGDGDRGGGMGLASMAARMRSVGGTLTVRHDDGRWHLRAEVPARQAATGEETAGGYGASGEQSTDVRPPIHGERRRV